MTGVKRKACGSKELDRPLSRFPLRGKAWAGMWAGKVPPTPRHVPRQQTTLARPVQAAPPARGISKRSAEIPLAHPPVSLRQQGIFMGFALTRTGLLMEAATVRECNRRDKPACSRG